MTTTQRLLDATADVWAQYNPHPFVMGLQDGTLDREKFRYYIVQDYLYLLEYAKVFSIGVAKAKSAQTTQLFSDYLAQLTGEEMNIHSGYMGKFAVTQQELDTTPRVLANLSYTSYMLRIAYEEGEAEILTAILSCACSYEVIAKNMVKANPASLDHPFYGDWVRGYASEGYAAGNVVLTEMLDRLTAGYSEQQLAHLVEIFTVCSRYELAFWDMAWSMAQ